MLAFSFNSEDRRTSVRSLPLFHFHRVLNIWTNGKSNNSVHLISRHIVDHFGFLNSTVDERICFWQGFTFVAHGDLTLGTCQLVNSSTVWSGEARHVEMYFSHPYHTENVSIPTLNTAGEVSTSAWNDTENKSIVTCYLHTSWKQQWILLKPDFFRIFLSIVWLFRSQDWRMSDCSCSSHNRNFLSSAVILWHFVDKVIRCSQVYWCSFRSCA